MLITVIRQPNALRNGLWIFVAGVWDYKAGIHRVYWRGRSAEEPMGTGPAGLCLRR